MDGTRVFRNRRSSSETDGIDFASKPLPTASVEASQATARPGLTSRTASAPMVPSLEYLNILDISTNQAHTPVSQRTSFMSILDDPFFQNYSSPDSVALSRELKLATHEEAWDHDQILDDHPLWPADIMTIADTSLHLPSERPNHVPEINIAVIGADGVGKSTLIQRALGLRTPPSTCVSSVQMSVENVVYTVSLIELDLELFDLDPDQQMKWPKQINGHIVPRISGALLLYDVMNRETITDLPAVLHGLSHSLLPTVLVSCKCDNPENTRQIDVQSMEAYCSSCVEAVKTAVNVPESARHCLSAMLQAIVANTIASNSTNVDPSGIRRRATSPILFEAPLDMFKDANSGLLSRPGTPRINHSRASSEYSFSRGTSSPSLAAATSTRAQNSISSFSRSLNSLGLSTRMNTNLRQQFTIPCAGEEPPPISLHPAFRHERNMHASPESGMTFNVAENPSNTPTPHQPMSGRVVDSQLLDMEYSSKDSHYSYSDDVPILQRSDESSLDKPVKLAGVTFGELVDRLIGQNISRADINFADIFLCLYRKFAAPGELFAAILSRLEQIANDSNTHYLIRTSDQLRIIGVIAKWVATYPGDFASPSTSIKVNGFINTLADEPAFAAAAQEIRAQFQSCVYEDDDTGWARTDADVEIENGNATELTVASPVNSGIDFSGTELVEMMHDVRAEEDDGEGLEHKEFRLEFPQRSSSPTPSFSCVEEYEREAATLIPKNTLPLTKFRYQIFMDIPDDDISNEMTRIDWVMFSSIRLRDLVRHVSLPLKQKERCKSLANVNRMINHFNHVARWVANMILIRDKAKHRALMLEKFMHIALKLRQLNNYNGLASVLAGINGTAIHRLHQTWNLVPVEVHKRFARLVILMGTQKGHFAYRLAWENSSLPRIPFIPLHRRDLVSAEEGSRTFVGANGDRINWRKFEVLSEVIMPIMKSQVVPYPNLTNHESARELILDCMIPTDDEEIYQRSLALESSSTTVDFGKKKFTWFQKERS